MRGSLKGGAANTIILWTPLEKFSVSAHDSHCVSCEKQSDTWRNNFLLCWQISRFTDIFSQVGVSPVQKQTQVSPSFTGNTGVLLLHNIIAHVKHTKDISCTRTYTCVCFNYIFCWKWCAYKKKNQQNFNFTLLYITYFII